jgi:adenosylcobinamide-phosphate synthase
LPHPVVAFGKAISYCENRFNQGSSRLGKGALVALLLVLATYGAFLSIEKITLHLGNSIHMAYVGIGLFFVLANRTLINEGKMVFLRLSREGTAAGRQQLSRIVGRDTSQLTPQQIRTAVLETMAENLSDGVVAPLFWFAVGGIPAAMAYKMVNTLDSMIGYKNDRYFLFGRVAARLDDAANFVPARLTALAMALVAFSWRGLVYSVRYGRCHSSPNSGYPEAALAGILDVRFGGPNVYHGKWVHKPFIGLHERAIGDDDFKKAAYINHAVCALFILSSAFVRYLLV